MLLARGADPNGEVCASGLPWVTPFGVHDKTMVNLLEHYGGVVYAANAGYYPDTDLARRLFADETARLKCFRSILERCNRTFDQRIRPDRPARSGRHGPAHEAR